ncbi:MAG: FMN-binding protein [Candidatus Roizmanbacteria bacterium]|nr:FMN-binding protein [Candidatus Roizmanbacteria bacterium]
MNSKTAGLLVIALIVAIGMGIFAFSDKANKETPPTSPKTAEVRQATSSYKDGMYEQLGDYTSPGGAEQIDVKLTLKNGVITETEVTPKADRPISKMKQEAFAKEYKSSVVGKNINDLQLGKIAGASLTPKGFNDALEKIKAQAKAV